ncbi:very short patch repair endonuclease [Longispora urticae]
MSRQRRRDTAPELALRKLVHKRGLRYLVDAALPGMRRRADMLFPRLRIAVFVDGCFWHSCPLHGTTPKTNTIWWTQKLSTNVARDRDTDERLAAEGWLVIRIWAHEAVEEAACRVEDAVQSRR